MLRGPNVGPPPAPEKWVIIREKSAGYAPGFTARDANGETWFISFDPPSNPKGATAAVVIANGCSGRSATTRSRPSSRASTRRELEIDAEGDDAPALGRAERRSRRTTSTPCSSARRATPTAPIEVAAGRLLPGKMLGPFRYEGTRPDDPNDIVPHEHRRELRALRVFGAWTNLTDLKAGNTLDTLVTENGRSVVKHYLQDVGSTFGMGANGPHDWDEGWEYFYQGNTTRRRLLVVRLRPEPVADGALHDLRFGRPVRRRPVRSDHVETAHADHGLHGNACRRCVLGGATGDGASPTSDSGGRQDRPVQPTRPPSSTWPTCSSSAATRSAAPTSPTVNPVVDPRLERGGVLTFGNAAVERGLATPPDPYSGRLVHVRQRHRHVQPHRRNRRPRPARGAARTAERAAGSYVKVALSAVSPSHPAWAQPIDVYFRSVATGWKLVGLERMPAVAAPGQPKGE